MVKKDSKQIAKPLILLIDRDKEILEFYNEFLMMVYENIRTLQSSGGDEAFRIVEEKSEEIAAIIANNRPDGIKGIELLKMVSQKYPKINFILSSSYLTDEEYNECRNYTNHIIYWPVQFNTLKEKIDQSI